MRQPPHMIARSDHVKNIWIKQYEKERRGKLIAVIPTVMAYSVGFWSGSIGHSMGFWLTTVCISIAIWYILRYFGHIYDIPTKI